MRLDLEKRAHGYRDVLRTTLQRLCANYIRAVRKKSLPEQETRDQMFQIHVQYLELCRYSQMVIANWQILQEDEQCRAVFVKDALVAMAAADGVERVKERAKWLRDLTFASHPDHKLVAVEVGSATVSI